MSEPICPLNCDTTLPDMLFSECNPVIVISQITDVLISLEAVEDITNATEMLDRIDNNSSDADAIRHLSVIGDKPKPNQTKKTISHDRVIVTKKDHLVNWKVDDVSDRNYEAMRIFECGGVYRCWFISGGYIFGGNSGILASINADNIITASKEDFHEIQGTLEWSKKFSPDRNILPFDLEEIYI